MVVVAVVFLAVTVVLWVSVGHSDQPQLLPLPVIVSVGHVAPPLLHSRPAQLGRHRAAMAVLEAQLWLRASFFREVQSIRTGLERRQAEFTGAQFRRLDAYAFSAVYCAGWKNGGHDSSEAFSGPRGCNGLWGGVGDVHPSNGVTPEIVGLYLFFSLSLSVNRNNRYFFAFCTFLDRQNRNKQMNCTKKTSTTSNVLQCKTCFALQAHNDLLIFMLNAKLVSTKTVSSVLHNFGYKIELVNKH